MIKSEELISPGSCLNRALPQERLFVLLARDASAPVAIRAWVKDRCDSGKNQWHDQVIAEALDCAAAMDVERETIRAQRDARV